MTLQPTSVEDLQAAVTQHPRVHVRGAGTKTALSAPRPGTPTLDVAGLTGVLEHTPEECTFTALAGTRIGAAHPRRNVGRREIAQPAQQVVHGIGRPTGTLWRQPGNLELQLRQRVAVQQLTQLLGAEQLAQQVAVQGERLGSPVHERRVAFVHVLGDVVEHQ